MRRKRCHCPCGARLALVDAAAILTFLLFICFLMFVMVLRWRLYLS